MRLLAANERIARCPTRCAVADGARAGFTLVDILVSIAVIATLIAIMLPSLGLVRETAHQVVCRSNIRQVGLGIAMFADERKDVLPASVFVRQGYQPATVEKPGETVTLRLEPAMGSGWDGLGHLFADYYLPAAQVFYCPSHKGFSRYTNYEEQWRDAPGRIMGNYQYRGKGPGLGAGPGQTWSYFLTGIVPSQSALVADSMRNRLEYNHGIGSNVLRADLSVYWYRDDGARVLEALSLNGDEATNPTSMGYAWSQLDGGE